MRSSLHPLFLTLSHSGGCCCNCDSGEDNRRLFRYIDAKCVAALAAVLFSLGKSAVCGFVQRKNGIKTNRRKMRKEATYERSEAAGKRVFYPDHGKKKGLRRDVNDICPWRDVNDICSFCRCVFWLQPAKIRCGNRRLQY